MSYGHNTALPGGGSTITLSPGDNTNIYQHQGRYIVATIQMGTGINIPTGATINFMKGTTKNSSGFLPLLGEPDPTQVPIVINAADPTKGIARLCVRHDPEDTTNTIKVYASAGGGWGVISTPADATGVSYNVLTYDPTVTIAGPTLVLIPVPAQSDGDDLSPSDPNGPKFTTQLSCTVVDNTTGTANPLSDYVVEWHEGGALSSGLFSTLMNAYDSATATYADVLVPKDGGSLIYDPTQEGYFVRMVTNSSGVANLYLVAKYSSKKFGSSVIAHFDFTDFTPLKRAFFVLDPTDNDLSESSPSIDQVESEPGGGNLLNFDDLTDPPNVYATITPYDGLATGDQLYLVANEQIVAGPYKPPPYPAVWSWNPTFPDSFLYSNTGVNANKPNAVLFVVVRANSTDILPSASNTFNGEGDTQQGLIPTDGPLAVPKLKPAAGVINLTYLKNNGVHVEIDLKHQPADCGWTPTQGDRLAATAYLSGWKTGGTVTQTAIVQATSVPLAQGDLTNGTVTLDFPSIVPFQDYDSKRGPKYRPSLCQIVYWVRPKGTPYLLLNSAVLQVVLNTANRS